MRLNFYIAEVEWMDGEKRTYEVTDFKEHDSCLYLSHQSGEMVARKLVAIIPLSNVRVWVPKNKHEWQ